ncbi:hypothetical protein [Actinokineospora globicatena]|uniref:hypothetical protein n=1 Tax=Actinokineospora globicatena TaxID=103729 RepID=UPI0020A4CDD5|nr:hypothetical protein [Actinokineospora globicatena]MCP2301441.1 hypothetical protein [Actinokineospora globicatena]GLW76920.1 hypothetical protein Aglo01_14020 [Actinokineospora globicatena]GLW83753.1 hypothetical protein Aglo02_13930 [Actinokineospora globicatena]
MAGADYNLQAIEQCRAAVAGQAGPVAGAGDALPRDADAGIFGTLPSSAGLASAVRALATTGSDELDRAGALLGSVDRALDAIGTSVANNEQAATRSLTV